MSEERIFDFSRSLFEVRRFFAGKRDDAGFQQTLAHARNEAPDSENARSGRNDGARKYLSRPRKAGTNF